MDNIKDDEYFLDKIIENLNIIIENTKNISKEDLKINSLLCDSVLFRIVQISEYSKQLSYAFKEKYQNIPWRAIVGMRNRIVHDYGEVDIGVIYTTTKVDIPNLLDILKKEKQH